MAARLVECGFTGEKPTARRPSTARCSRTASIRQRRPRTSAANGCSRRATSSSIPTGRYVHSAIDALEDLLSRSGKLDLARIERIEVKAYRLAAMLKEKRVTSSFGARFSVPFALATILHHGRSELAAFEQPAVDNPAIQALAARVHVQEEAELHRALPGRAARATCASSCPTDERSKGVAPSPRASRPSRTGPRSCRRNSCSSACRCGASAVARRLLEGCMRLEELPDFSRFAEGFDL